MHGSTDVELCLVHTVLSLVLISLCPPPLGGYHLLIFLWFPACEGEKGGGGGGDLGFEASLHMGVENESPDHALLPLPHR